MASLQRRREIFSRTMLIGQVNSGDPLLEWVNASGTQNPSYCLQTGQTATSVGVLASNNIDR